ncbi:MAG TPA: hypothetical protein VKA60_07185 [Blastocatellia bacterium]|nr:hypothetical protein [Blastocatellia bacterium]
MIIKRTCVVTILAVLLAALPLSSFAQEREQSAAAAKPAKRKLNDITGAWLFTLTISDAAAAADLPLAARRFVRAAATQPSFDGTETFNEDGTFAENSLSDYLPPVGTPGRGEWIKTGDHEFALTFYGVLFVSFDNPTVIGTYKVRSKITLGASGTTFSAPAVIDIFDPAGNLLVTLSADVQGRRAVVEPLP